MKFDTKTIEKLKSYVYALIDPSKNPPEPFYIGKGIGNRVFNHVACALDDETDSNNKYETIKNIKKSGKEIEHIIIRHGLTDNMAIAIEASFLDLFNYLGYELTNKVLGHNSLDNGLMSAKEIIGKYNAEKLDELSDPAVIININKSYPKQKYQDDGVYMATKESWSMDKHKVKSIKYVLSEYQGLIVEVYQVHDWYPIDAITSTGKYKQRWGFNGSIAEDKIRNKYINKSVAKRRGAANPIKYNL
jgi:hypothetical protein